MNLLTLKKLLYAFNPSWFSREDNFAIFRENRGSGLVLSHSQQKGVLCLLGISRIESPLKHLLLSRIFSNTATFFSFFAHTVFIVVRISFFCRPYTWSTWREGLLLDFLFHEESPATLSFDPQSHWGFAADAFRLFRRRRSKNQHWAKTTKRLIVFCQ